MKSLKEQVTDLGKYPSHFFNQENMGSMLGLSYSDVWNPQTNRPKTGWKILGGTVYAKGVEVMFERESDGQKAFFHIPSN